MLNLIFAADAPSGGIMSNPLLMFGFIAVIWIFLLIIPQRKEQKRKEKMQAGLKKGDRILLQCGIIGKVSAMKDETVILDFDGTKIPFLRAGVVKVLDENAGGPEKKS